MAPETQTPTILRFGVFEADLRAGEVRKQGVRIKLQEQPFHVLKFLLQRPGEAITREELRSEIWQSDTFVDFDNSLNTSVNKLREALGDSADSPRFIETLPRRGYRFIAPVTSVDGTTRGTATDGSVVAPARWWKIVVTVAVVMFAAGIVGGLLRRARQARSLTEKDVIVLGDFANSTGNAVFDDALKQGLRVQLEQSPFLNILSDEKVSEELQLMGRAKDERLTKELARDLCQRVGGKALLAGSISSLGTHYVIGLSALNCHSGDGLASEQVEADSREHVLRALGESATHMRKKLGESLSSVQKYDAPVEQATTPSLEALKAYSLGMKAWHAEGEAAAIPFFKRAVELDPHFAMAYALLGTRYQILREVALSDANTRKAYELREKVSERERLYIEAQYYSYETGELEKAMQVYEVWQRTYPRDLVPYENLATVYAGFGRFDDALKEARETLRLEPDNQDSYSTAAYTYLRLNLLENAEAVLKQAEEHKLQSENLIWYRYRLAFMRRDRKEMERLMAVAARKPDAENLLLPFAAWAEAYYGRRRSARELWRRWAKSGGLLDMSSAGMMEAYWGNSRQARADAYAGLRLAPIRRGQIYAAFALALAGDSTQAEKLAAEVSKERPLDTGLQCYWLPTVRAAVALDRKNPDKAVELLQSLSPRELGTMTRLEPIYVRGQAHLMQRNGGAAAGEFQKIIDHPGIVGTLSIGALAHLGLARAYALQGDTAKSRAAYQDFLTLWKDADPDIPMLLEARAEYAKLQ